MTPLLVCQNLQLKNGYRTLLENISLTLNAGDYITLEGPNGSGKTSLLNAFAGLRGVSAGTLQRTCPAFYMPHVPALFLDHSVLWNLEFYSQTFFVTLNHTAVLCALERVGLLGRQKQAVRTLSAGQKRRLMLAAIVLLHPKLILADEPTCDLDSQGTALCLDIFQEMRAQKSALVVATHDPRVSQICTNSVLLTPVSPRVLQKSKAHLNLSFW